MGGQHIFHSPLDSETLMAWYAASVLYFAGMDIVSISNHLGHASPSTTQNIYSHMIAEAESRAAAAMGQLLLKSTEKPSEDKPQKKHTAG